MILCKYVNERRWPSADGACFNPAERFLMDVGGRTGRIVPICAHHYSIMSDEALRAWQEVSQAEYDVFKVHEQ